MPMNFLVVSGETIVAPSKSMSASSTSSTPASLNTVGSDIVLTNSSAFEIDLVVFETAASLKKDEAITPLPQIKNTKDKIQIKNFFISHHFI